MKVHNGSYFCDVNLESKIMEAWNLSHDLNLLNQAMLDFCKSREVAIKILDGIIEIYEVRMNLLDNDYQNIFLALKNKGLTEIEEWNDLYLGCYNIIADLRVLSYYMNDKNKSMTTDELSNAILGLETLTNVKFELLFDKFQENFKYLHQVIVFEN
jgi:hypothetical protein